MTTEEFIERARAVHGDRYGYGRAEYVNQKTKVTITCPEHGDFEQNPWKHYGRSFGCPSCSNRRRLTTEEFIERARAVHGDRYGYGRTVYSSRSSKVTVTCPEHGDFEQLAGDHLSGKGCRLCSGFSKRDTGDFVREAKGVHGDKYDYGKTVYSSHHEPVTVTCPEHGDFEQLASVHLRGSDCPECANRTRGVARAMDPGAFVERARAVHGDRYGYSGVSYETIHSKITISCPEHGDFEQTPNSHLNLGQGCPACGRVNSRGERELREFVAELLEGEEVRGSDRSLIGPKELDVYVPGRAVAVEYNGLLWHSDRYRDKGHLLRKTVLCGRKGVRLVHVFEDEWREKGDIVRSRIRHILGASEWRAYARECEIAVLGHKEKSEFMRENHIQGDAPSSVAVGLVAEEGILAVMTFCKSRFDKSFQWELLRYASLLDCSVVGGASRLLKWFEREHGPKSLVSYADRRWSDGGLYRSLGFEPAGESAPSYHYAKKEANAARRFSRMAFQKHKLGRILDKFDPSLSEGENMSANGYYRVYDCGNLVFHKRY